MGWCGKGAAGCHFNAVYIRCATRYTVNILQNSYRTVVGTIREYQFGSIAEDQTIIDGKVTVRSGVKIKCDSRIGRIINIQVFPDQEICIGQGFNRT